MAYSNPVVSPASLPFVHLLWFFTLNFLKNNSLHTQGFKMSSKNRYPVLPSRMYVLKVENECFIHVCGLKFW